MTTGPPAPPVVPFWPRASTVAKPVGAPVQAAASLPAALVPAVTVPGAVVVGDRAQPVDDRRDEHRHGVEGERDHD
ncbi:hypothetical protein, partial [Streptosporangium sp. NPDC048865]|uniref:hypothetical protein n=1 Tax=Streptosporangium sp. NPDC048865 TaxID=3155766 RepID=UPI00341704C1